METKFSSGSSTRPRTRFSSLPAGFEFFGMIFLNSSQSPRIKFIHLSNALKEPMKTGLQDAPHPVVDVLQHLAALTHSCGGSSDGSKFPSNPVK